MRFKEFPASGNIEILGKQNEVFPLGPAIKCLMLNAGHSKLPYLSANVVQRMSLSEKKTRVSRVASDADVDKGGSKDPRQKNTIRACTRVVLNMFDDILVPRATRLNL